MVGVSRDGMVKVLLLCKNTQELKDLGLLHVETHKNGRKSRA